MITASLATIPGREAALERAVRSLLPQVDAVYVYLNGHARPPEICRRPQVLWAGTCAGGQDYGDAAKFAYTGYYPPGRYILTCDDDLEYAPGYVEHMVEAVERYGRRYVVSLHGRRIATPARRYYKNHGREVFRCLSALDRDEPVHVPGTGVMAYHTDTVRFSLDDFPPAFRNMADIHVGVKLQRHGIGAVVVAHPEGMVQQLPIDLSATIHARHVNDDARQVERINGVGPWRLHAQTPVPS